MRRVRELFADRFVIQQFIPGRTYVATLIYDQVGKLVIGVGMRSHRTFFTWGGGGCAGEMVDEPDMVRLTDEVVQACGGWCGPINFEWRRHAETDAWYLMEANCRLNGYSYLTTMNGVPLPRIVLALLTGDPLPPVSAPSERTRNFTLGFRETLIGDWISAGNDLSEIADPLRNRRGRGGAAELSVVADFQNSAEQRFAQLDKARAFARRREQALPGRQRQVFTEIADVARDAIAEHHDKTEAARRRPSRSVSAIPKFLISLSLTPKAPMAAARFTSASS